MIIDIHSHLDHPLLNGRIDEIIKNAMSSNVRHIITNGIDPATNRLCLGLSERYDIVKCGMGAYPRDLLKREAESGYTTVMWDYDIEIEIEFIKQHRENISAVSEIGLDFTYGENPMQIEDFQRMISLAEDIKKPVVIHSRKAEQRCVEILESSNMRNIIMHCFCGKKSLVKRIRDNGWFFSIPTSVVRAEQFQMIINEVPLSQLFCETDSPYLSPFKDKPNEPSFVFESYKKIAEIKKMEFVEVVNNIYLNWQRVFW